MGVFTPFYSKREKKEEENIYLHKKTTALFSSLFTSSPKSSSLSLSRKKRFMQKSALLAMFFLGFHVNFPGQFWFVDVYIGGCL